MNGTSYVVPSDVPLLAATLASGQRFDVKATLDSVAGPGIESIFLQTVLTLHRRSVSIRLGGCGAKYVNDLHLIKHYVDGILLDHPTTPKRCIILDTKADADQFLQDHLPKFWNVDVKQVAELYPSLQHLLVVLCCPHFKTSTIIKLGEQMKSVRIGDFQSNATIEWGTLTLDELQEQACMVTYKVVNKVGDWPIIQRYDPSVDDALMKIGYNISLLCGRKGVGKSMLVAYLASSSSSSSMCVDLSRNIVEEKH